jgi:GNAT superfamily N-acetyltransferase
MPELAITPVPVDSPAARGLLEERGAGVPAGMRSGGPVVRASDFAAPGGVFLLAGGPPGPVGCAGLRELGPGVGELKRLYVRPGARRGGVASALVRAVERRAVELGYRELCLDTHAEGAAALFRGVGYRAVPDYNGNPNARWWFAKTLTGAAVTEALAREWWWARQLAVSGRCGPGGAARWCAPAATRPTTS